MFAEQEFNASFREPTNPPPFFSSGISSNVTFKVYLDEIDTFTATEITYTTPTIIDGEGDTI